MKLVILLFLVFLGGFTRIAVGQKNIQFIYIGSEPCCGEDVLITSADFRGDYLKGKDSRLTKLYYTDQRTLDTLRSFISRSNWVKRSDTSNRENIEIDMLKSLDAFKIIGVDSFPLYIAGHDCYKLFSSTWIYLGKVRIGRIAGYTAMNRLMFECHEEFLRRDLDTPQPVIIEDPYHRLKSKPNN